MSFLSVWIEQLTIVHGNDDLAVAGVECRCLAVDAIEERIVLVTQTDIESELRARAPRVLHEADPLICRVAVQG